MDTSQLPDVSGQLVTADNPARTGLPGMDHARCAALHNYLVHYARVAEGRNPASLQGDEVDDGPITKNNTSSGFGDCCSPYGFCGSGPDYCVVNNGTASTDGTCGGTSFGPAAASTATAATTATAAPAPPDVAGAGAAAAAARYRTLELLINAAGGGGNP
ncbi:hypothetical protein L209DRAFT_569248 [Thermothelomyces heterothallicus CBS 203.75]